MSCAVPMLYMRAGDAWPVTFRYKVDGVVVDLTGLTAELRMLDVAGSAIYTTDSATGDLSIPTPSNGEILLSTQSADTAAWAIGGVRTDLTMALRLYDATDEDGTTTTISTSPVTVLPRVFT